MSGQLKPNICFYSNACKWSRAFIEELAQTPWIREFEFICIDKLSNGQRPQLPRWLKQVPTLVIKGDEEPVKIDSEVMNWLYEKKLKEMPRKAAAHTPAAMGGEPQSWNMNEMGGMGDAGYTFLDSDTSTQGNGGSTIPGAFTYLQGQASPGERQSEMGGGYGGGGGGGGRRGGDFPQAQPMGRSKKEQMFDAQMDQYMRNRDVGMPKKVMRQ